MLTHQRTPKTKMGHLGHGTKGRTQSQEMVFEIFMGFLVSYCPWRPDTEEEENSSSLQKIVLVRDLYIVYCDQHLEGSQWKIIRSKFISVGITYLRI